jgi:hypothetical protein
VPFPWATVEVVPSALEQELAFAIERHSTVGTVELLLDDNVKPLQRGIGRGLGTVVALKRGFW